MEAMIAEHMAVIGSDGEHVGVVDHVEGTMIKLTRSDAEAQGQHHYIPLSWVEEVTEAVLLSVSSQQAMQEWQTEEEYQRAHQQSDADRDPYAANRERSIGGEIY